MTQYFKNKIYKILSLFNLRLTKINYLPIETDDNVKKFINVSSKFSMTGNERMYLLSQAVLNAKNNNLEGDFVECGVWMGGNILLYKLLNNFYNLNKTIFAYDTFQGMTAPEDIDIDNKKNYAHKILKLNKKSESLKNIHCLAKIDTVKKNILK